MMCSMVDRAGSVTPAEAAGINIQGDNKFLTLLQAARSYD